MEREADGENEKGMNGEEVMEENSWNTMFYINTEVEMNVRLR